MTEDLYKIVFNNELNINEIKEFFKKNKVDLNYLKNVTMFLIEDNFSFQKIEVIIEEQQQQFYQKQQQSVNNKELLFYSIEYNNFETARLLLKYGTRIDSLNTESKNITEYLIEKRKLDSEKLQFILKIVKDASLITSKIICHLIELNDIQFIEKLLKFKYFDISLIINLLLNYRNKTKLSKREFQNKIFNLNASIIKINSKTETGEYPLMKAIINNNITIVKLLIEYAYKNNFNLNLFLNVKNSFGETPLSKAINNKNIEIVELLLGYIVKNNIILNLNAKNNYGFHLILFAYYKNDIYMTTLKIYMVVLYFCVISNNIQLLLKYPQINNLILELNKKNSLLSAIKNVIEYAKENNINLNVNEKVVEDDFS